VPKTVGKSGWRETSIEAESRENRVLPIFRKGITVKQKVSCNIIVVNYNGVQYLRTCLGSLKSQSFTGFEIILVDNNSSDQSVDYVRSKFPDVAIVRSEENLGYAGGCNLGAHFASSDYLIFVNNDMEFPKNWLEEMVSTASSNESIGIVTCKVIESPRAKRIQHIGSTCDIFGYPAGYGTGEIDRGQYDKLTEVFFAVGDALMMKRSLFFRLGGFDPKFFLYSDDLDLSWRTWLSGYKVIVNPSAIAYHMGRGSVKDTIINGTNLLTNPTRRYLGERNTLRTLLKNYKGQTLISVLPAYFSLLLAEVSFFAIKKEVHLVKSDITAVFWNLRNLRDTLILRSIVQRLRRVEDGDVKKMMLSGSMKLSLFRKLLTS
jgi:GT2 family glycosyltransferase